MKRHSGRPPRVLCISPPVESPWTRADRVLLRGVASHSSRWEVTLVSRSGAEILALRPDATIRTETLWSSTEVSDGGVRDALRFFRRLVRKDDFDLVHVFWDADPVLATLVRAARRLRPRRALHTLTHAPRTTVGVRFALCGAPIVVLTEETRRRLLAEGVLDVAWIPNGVEVQEPTPEGLRAGIRARHGLPLDRPIVVYAGDYTHTKAAHTVAAAVPRILRDLPAHFVFACLIRNDNDVLEESRIKNALAADGLAAHVSFFNQVPSVRELLSVATVQVLPTDDDREKLDLPMVLLDGMHEGVPAVVANRPPLDELVRAGAAVPVPVMDPMAISVAVADLIRDETLRKKVAAKGRTLIERDHDIAKVARQYETLWDEVMRQPLK